MAFFPGEKFPEQAINEDNQMHCFPEMTEDLKGLGDFIESF